MVMRRRQSALLVVAIGLLGLAAASCSLIKGDYEIGPDGGAADSS